MGAGGTITSLRRLSAAHKPSHDRRSPLGRDKLHDAFASLAWNVA